MGGGLDVAGDQAEQEAAVDQAVEQRLDAGHDPVPVGLRDGVRQVLEVAADRLRSLFRAALAADRLAEDDRGDLGVGHAGVGVLGDVDVDPVQLLEGALPGDAPGAAGDEQGPVDVEEDRLDHPGS